MLHAINGRDALVSEPLLILLVRQPFKDNSDDDEFLVLNGVEQSPAAREIVLPEVVYAVLELVLFWNQPFLNLDAAEAVLLDAVDRTLDMLCEEPLFVLAFLESFELLFGFSGSKSSSGSRRHARSFLL